MKWFDPNFNEQIIMYILGSVLAGLLFISFMEALNAIQ